MVTKEHLAQCERTVKLIEKSREQLNALCAEATQLGLKVSMGIRSLDTTALGDTYVREYQELLVDVCLPLKAVSALDQL